MNESMLPYCPSPTLSDYVTFTDEITARYRELELEANEKLQKEQLSFGSALNLPSWVPGIGNEDNQGDTAACKFEETGVLVREFASEDLAGNYEALQSMWDSLDKAQSILNGEESPSQEPGSKPAVLGDAEIGAVTTGLASWKNTTADTFRTKYVYSIGPRKANQLDAIGESKRAVQIRSDILIETRGLALGLLQEAKKSLDDYNPLWETGKGMAYAAGVITGTVASNQWLKAGSLVATETIEKSGLSVAGLMEALRENVTKCRQGKNDAEDKIAHLLRQATNRRGSESTGDGHGAGWDDHVLDRPGN